MVTMKLVVVHVVFDSQDPKVPAAPNDPAAGYGGGRERCGHCQLSIALEILSFETLSGTACFRSSRKKLLPLVFNLH